MTTRERVSLAVCVILHIVVLVNVYIADQHTPRTVNIQECARPQHHSSGVVRL